MKAPELATLKSRLAHTEWRIGCCDQMIRDAHLWGSRVAVAIEDRAQLASERELLFDQIQAIQQFESAARGRFLS